MNTAAFRRQDADVAALYGTPIWRRLLMHRNPLPMAFSSGVWASAWYLFSYIIISTVLFTTVVTMTVTSGALVVIWAGLPLLIGTAYFIRGCVVMERGRTRAVVPEGLPPIEPMQTSDGFFANLRAIWSDRVILRALAHFTLLFVPLLVLGTVVLVTWLTALGMITLPIWYRYIPGSDEHQGQHGVQIATFFVDSDLKAAVAAVVGLVVFLAWNYVLVATARVHAMAVRVVITGRDPLAPARRVLESPGPLSTASGS